MESSQSRRMKCVCQAGSVDLFKCCTALCGLGLGDIYTKVLGQIDLHPLDPWVLQRR